MIPEDSCKKNWNNKKNTPTNQMVIFEFLIADKLFKVVCIILKLMEYIALLCLCKFIICNTFYFLMNSICYYIGIKDSVYIQ